VIEVEARSELDPRQADVEALAARVRWACERLGLSRAGVGLLLVGPDRMAELNLAHRGVAGPTDVLAFPLDGPQARGRWPAEGPAPELGDIVICPAAAQEPLSTLAVHGLLHLLGYDHETDAGEMLALQDELVRAGLRG
jgi:probable rRNA maturation factor